MADNDNKSAVAPTHTAYAFKREGKKFGRWLEVGKARTEQGGFMRVLLDRLPIGGFGGGILLVPLGGQPPAAEDDDEVTD